VLQGLTGPAESRCFVELWSVRLCSVRPCSSSVCHTGKLWYCCAVGTFLIALVAFAVGITAGHFIGRSKVVEVRAEAPRIPIPEPAPARIEAPAPEVTVAAVSEIVTQPAPPPPPKRKLRETTVMVCDVGSDSPQDDVPANVLRCLSDLQRILAGIIGDEGGSVDRFAGDRVIAVFSAKGRRTDHAGHALEAAQRIANNVDAVSRRLGHDIRIGIGVHSGSLPTGGDGRVDETLIGDVIDVASRLEALATEAKVSVIVSEDVLQRAEGDGSAFESIGEVALGTGQAARRLFALKSRDGAAQLDLIDLHSTTATRPVIAPSLS
jgi:class 3 adenylate cyclase